MSTTSTPRVPADPAATDALVERLFGALLDVVDVHAAHFGNWLGCHRRSPAPARSPPPRWRPARPLPSSAPGEWLELHPASGWSSRP